MKVVYLGYQDIFGEINNGGMQGARKNWELIVSNIGYENIFTVIISNNKHDSKLNIRYFKKADGNLQSFISNLFLCRYYMPSEEKKILRHIDEISPDIVFIDTSTFGRIVKKISQRYKTIVFFHNVEIDYAKHRIKKEGIKLLPMYISTKYNEKIAIRYADKMVGLNVRDAKKIEEYYGRKIDNLVPVGFRDIYDIEQVKRKKNKNLLFIGSYFPPNYDGVKWFIENIMNQLSDYHLIIVGKDFERVRKDLENENVTVIGTVEDVRPYYYENSMVVMPIRYGEGMKVKTAEAMMYGMTIFATDEALEGYDVDNVEGIYRCNTSKEFIHKILEYSQNEFKYENKVVREIYRKNNSYEMQVEIMRQILNNV